MMKAALLMGMMAAMVSCGCNDSSSTAAQTPDNLGAKKPAQRSETSESAETSQSLPPATGWRTLYRDEKKDKIRKLFERAKELVEQKTGLHGELDIWSSYFGSWVVVIIKPQACDPEDIILDAPSSVARAYLVDMTHEIVIEKGDWEAARPFFESQMALFDKGFGRSDDKENFIYQFATSVSVIAFGHNLCLEKPLNGVRYPKTVAGPVLKRRKDKTELVYYICHDGMTLSYTRCTFTMAQSELSFQSDPVEV